MHIESEGLRTIRDYLVSINAHIRMAKLYSGDSLPVHVNEFDAVIVTGGPMNVYQEDKYPFLRGETAFIRQGS